MDYSEGDWEEGDCSGEKMLDMNKALQMLDEWIRDEPIDCSQEEADASLPAVNVGAQAHVRSSTSLLLVQDGSGSITSDMECASSCSSSSSSSSGGLDHGNHQATIGRTGAKRTPFPDLKKIIVKKQIMDKAVERLGGGRKGALMLWRLVQVWLKHQEGTVDHASLLMKPSELGLGLPDCHQLANLSSIALQPAAAGGQGHYGYSHLQFSNGPNVLPAMAADTIVSNASSYYQGQMGSPRPMLPVHHSSSINRNHFQPSQLMHERNVRAAAAVQDKKSQDAPISAEARNWNSAATRAARKSRMQQQRKSLAHQRSRACMSSSLNWSSTSSTSFPGGNVCVPSLDQHGTRVRNSEKKNLRLLMQKDLRPSDVGNLGRIVLPKKEAELHLPFLSLREGITLSMEDMSTSQLWHFKYSRFWPNNKSRMYLLENTGEFVKCHGLQEGDSILLYRDHKAGKYVIYGKKNAKLPDAVSLEEGSGVKGGSSIVSECQAEVLAINPGMYTDGLSELERFPSLELGDLTIDQILGVEALKETSKTSSNENG